MLTCPKCQASVPEEMRFCLQCGALLAPTPPPVAADPVMPAAPAVSEPLQRTAPTVPLKIAPTPVIAPRGEAAVELAPPHAGDQIDDESLRRSFERQVRQPGAVICRFCKGPLDLEGDFCEQCGAPVSEAAPPGMVRLKPQPAAPAAPPPVPSPPPSKPVQAAPPARPPAATAPTRQSTAPPPVPAKPAAHSTPTRTPAPPIPTPPAEEAPSGLMGRLKGLFKKG